MGVKGLILNKSVRRWSVKNDSGSRMKHKEEVYLLHWLLECKYQDSPKT